MVAGVSRETLARLQCYVACLQRWNTTINLVSAGDLGEIWDRHVADGIAMATLLPDRPGLVTDLGSGAGIPGMVAAIITGRTITLVESDRRKAAFLVEAAREVGAPVTILPTRAEKCGVRGQAVVMARALAPLHRLLAYCTPLLDPDGCGLFLKGHDSEAEIAQARQSFSFNVIRHTVGGSLILEVTHVTPAL